MLVDIGEALSAVGPLVGGILRRQVLTRQFESGLALGHLSKGLATAAGVAQACGVQAPLLAACRDAWAAAETSLGSGADQSALIRWLETLVPPRQGPRPDLLSRRSVSAFGIPPLEIYSTITCPYIHGWGAQM